MEEVKRNDSGVRVRADGGGDLWADRHRLGLDNKAYLTDADSFTFAVRHRKSEDRVFFEYVPDDWCNFGKSIRSFALLAIFERKSPGQYQRDLSGLCAQPGVAFLLHTCRLFGQVQPIAPRFFFVFGDDQPFRLQEIDCIVGYQVGELLTLPILTNKGDWLPFWKQLGLIDARDKLNAWVKNGCLPPEPDIPF